MEDLCPASFCENLNEFLMEEFGYKKRYTCNSSWGLTIMAQTKRYDLYFRWLPSSSIWEKNTLVIARIGFHEARAGHGTRLLQFICEHCHTFGYQHIGIESSNHCSSEFAKHFGFKSLRSKDWVISIEELSKKFAPSC